MSLNSDDSSRVKLKEIAGEDGSDYINVSHLDVKKIKVLYMHVYIHNRYFHHCPGL